MALESPAFASGIVRFNVGGQAFATSKHNLVRFEDSMLAVMVRTEVGVLRDPSGAIFIDRDPTYFQSILNFLRDGDVPQGWSEQDCSMLRKEAAFYGLPELANAVSNTTLRMCGHEAKQEICSLVGRTFTGWSKWGKFTPYRDIRGNYRVDERFLQDALGQGPEAAVVKAQERLAFVEANISRLNARGEDALNMNGHYRDLSDPVPDGLEVVSVQQVSNPERMSTYNTVKSQMLMACGDSGSWEMGFPKHGVPAYGTPELTAPRTSHQKVAPLERRINEVYLWHGTSPANARMILRDNFDLQRAGQTNGASYGRGAYLAESCLQADEYTAPEDGVYPLLLCRVLLGKVHVCRDAHVDPASIERGFERGEFNSVLGDREHVEETYREFIVYNNAQIFPEFLVWYKKMFTGYMGCLVDEEVFRSYS